MPNCSSPDDGLRRILGPRTLGEHLLELEREHDEWLEFVPDSGWQDDNRGSQELTPVFELEQFCRFPWFGPGDDDAVRYIVAGIGHSQGD